MSGTEATIRTLQFWQKRFWKKQKETSPSVNKELSKGSSTNESHSEPACFGLLPLSDSYCLQSPEASTDLGQPTNGTKGKKTKIQRRPVVSLENFIAKFSSFTFCDAN